MKLCFVNLTFFRARHLTDLFFPFVILVGRLASELAVARPFLLTLCLNLLFVRMSFFAVFQFYLSNISNTFRMLFSVVSFG